MFLPAALGPGAAEKANPAPARLLRDLLTQMSERIDGRPYRSPWGSLIAARRPRARRWLFPVARPAPALRRDRSGRCAADLRGGARRRRRHPARDRESPPAVPIGRGRRHGSPRALQRRAERRRPGRPDRQCPGIDPHPRPALARVPAARDLVRDARRARLEPRLVAGRHHAARRPPDDLLHDVRLRRHRSRDRLRHLFPVPVSGGARARSHARRRPRARRGAKRPRHPARGPRRGGGLLHPDHRRVPRHPRLRLHLRDRAPSGVLGDADRLSRRGAADRPLAEGPATQVVERPSGSPASARSAAEPAHHARGPGAGVAGALSEDHRRRRDSRDGSVALGRAAGGLRLQRAESPGRRHGVGRVGAKGRRRLRTLGVRRALDGDVPRGARGQAGRVRAPAVRLGRPERAVGAAGSAGREDRRSRAPGRGGGQRSPGGAPPSRSGCAHGGARNLEAPHGPRERAKRSRRGRPRRSSTLRERPHPCSRRSRGASGVPSRSRSPITRHGWRPTSPSSGAGSSVPAGRRRSRSATCPKSCDASSSARPATCSCRSTPGSTSGTTPVRRAS